MKITASDMKLRPLILLLSFPFMLLYGCGPSASLENAERERDLKRFHSSAQMLEEVYGMDEHRESRDSIAYYIADNYSKVIDFRRAERWYERAIQLEYPNEVVHLDYGKFLMKKEEYEDAIEQFQKYQERNPGDEEVANLIERSKKAVGMKEERTRWRAESFRPANSAGNDFAPILTDRDRTLYFTSDRADAEGRNIYGWTGQDHTSIFKMEKARGRGGDNWQRPELLRGVVTSEFNDGVNAFPQRGNDMFYTQCNGPEGELANCQIYKVTERGRTWEDKELMPFCEDTTVNYAHPTLSPDGDRMYFVSDMDGDNYDIYVSNFVRRGGTWSDPINLGDNINSDGDEMFPRKVDENTLYFSSNGHGGMGGLDMYKAEGRGTDWSEPENLGPPFNSGADDFAITFKDDGESGFFSSNRSNQTDNIYRFYREPLEFTLSGTVYDAEEQEPLENATVELSSSVADEDRTVETDETGYYEFELEKDAHFEFFADKEEFFRSQDEIVSTAGEEFSKDFEVDLYLQPFPDPEDLIAIEGIYYDLDEYFIRDDAEPVLDSVANILHQYPDIRIELGSHTDCRASPEYNEELSQNRAEAAVEYLVEAGIDEGRLVPRGYGEEEPVIKCACPSNDFERDCTDEEHQKNRRTTFQLLREEQN